MRLELTERLLAKQSGGVSITGDTRRIRRVSIAILAEFDEYPMRYSSNCFKLIFELSGILSKACSAYITVIFGEYHTGYSMKLA
ncbi:hypothetical protein KSP39_PZI002382 [Platanthera zijinensis]|uniref:Uncharacterized protein n=1 Tax=Platanthera zijinensis TaxID=2320716 RepID=A0AAP0BXK6_9ASPA